MIYLGSDHGGFDLKEKIKIWLTAWGYQWEDMGNRYYEEDDDYPTFAIAVGEKVVVEEQEFPTPWSERPKGILACRSAAGMVIAANKVKGIRSASVFNVISAKHSRQHNDSNILALSGDWLEEYQAKEILQAWLTTEFSGEERHIRRLKQIKEYEDRSNRSPEV